MSPLTKLAVLIVVVSLWSASHPAEAQLNKSLFFGIDGMGFGTQGFSVANTPVMDSLIDGTWQAGYSGAYTDQAFAGGVVGTPTEQITVSGPGWSTMLTGVWRDRHGVNGNGSSFANGDYANNPPYLATLKETLPTLSTASYVYWPPIDDYVIGSIDIDGDPTNDVNFRASYSDDDDTIAAAVAGIGDMGGLDPDAVFVSVDLVDAAGHDGGSSSAGYKQAIEKADGYVGQALATIASRPDFATEDWQIVITSDHGHRAGGGHGGQSDLERTIPFIVASKNLQQGALPIFPQQVSHADVSPTVLEHFGVPIPSHYYGISRAGGGLIGNADINRDGIVSGNGNGLFEDDDVVAFVSLWLDPNTIENPNLADLNLDGIVNLADWSILNAENPSMGNAIAATLAGRTVPEPGTLGLVAIGLVGATWFGHGRLC